MNGTFTLERTTSGRPVTLPKKFRNESYEMDQNIHRKRHHSSKDDKGKLLKYQIFMREKESNIILTCVYHVLYLKSIQHVCKMTTLLNRPPYHERISEIDHLYFMSFLNELLHWLRVCIYSSSFKIQNLVLRIELVKRQWVVYSRTYSTCFQVIIVDNIYSILITFTY